MIEDIYNKFWLSLDDFNRKLVEKNSYVTPERLTEITNIKYGDDEEQFFDIYYPNDLADKKLPTIVHIHGGAYISGVHELYSEYCRILADRGYCVINLEYIKGLRKGFPSPVFDFFKFFEYIQNDPEIAKHVDFDKFLISGDSSGGHVAALVANIQSNPNVKKEFGLTGGPDIKGCILICPMLGVYKFRGLWPKKRFAKLVYKEYYDYNYKNVDHTLETATKDFPPSIIVSARNDFIKLHAYLFEKKAKKLNLYLEHYCITTGKHLTHCSMIAFPYEYENKVALKKIIGFASHVINNKLTKGVMYQKINKKSPLDDDFKEPTVDTAATTENSDATNNDDKTDGSSQK